MYYDNKEALKGTVRELAAKRLGASETDKIEYGTYTWDSGFCETCSYTEYEFVVLLNGEVVYDSKGNQYIDGYDIFGAFQDWLDGVEDNY